MSQQTQNQPAGCLADSLDASDVVVHGLNGRGGARSATARVMPMGSLIAALLVALWMPTAPLMAAALINGEASGILQPGVLGGSATKPNQKPSGKPADLQRLTRLSVALIVAACASQTETLRPCAIWPGLGVVDEPLLDRGALAGQRWTNTSDSSAWLLEPAGLLGGTVVASVAGLIALPPPLFG